VQVHTSGLGGDSELRWEPQAGLVLGPRRHIPLSLLAMEHAGVEVELARQLRRGTAQEHDGRFAVLLRDWHGQEGRLEARQRDILRRVEQAPVALELLFAGAESSYLLAAELRRLTERGFLGIAGFTPSDACHVLGLQSGWSVPAARLGAQLAARLYSRQRGNRAADRSAADPLRSKRAASDSSPLALSETELCREVLAKVMLQSGRAVAAALLAEAYQLNLEELPRVRQVFVDQAVFPDGDCPLRVELALKNPLVAIGAPAATYYPEVSRRLHTELCVPPHAPVANAIGAVVGSVTQTVRVLISSQAAGEIFRVHLLDGVHDFPDLQEAADFAAAQAEAQARELAARAGATSARIVVQRRDHTAVAAGEELFLESEIVATSTGRPHLAHDS
jgi:N-methylhydantoinase A/oxoprolinase/acetone carboxylase beta subunit